MGLLKNWLTPSRLDYSNSLLIDLPLTHIQRLQSVQNAAARLVFNLRCSESQTRWRCWCIVLCMVPHHLTWSRHSHVLPTCHTDAGSGPPPLNSLTCRRLTIGGCAFPVAGAKVWNSLPSDVTSASSLPVFKNRLKTYLFHRCYETVWLWITFLVPSHYLPSRKVVLAIVFTV